MNCHFSILIEAAQVLAALLSVATESELSTSLLSDKNGDCHNLKPKNLILT